MYKYATNILKGSRPTRARGLKLRKAIELAMPDFVAPHAGAWIETTYLTIDVPTAFVAPHAGAWIETSTFKATLASPLASRPTRARGLKPLHAFKRRGQRVSRPTRARGLKQ